MNNALTEENQGKLQMNTPNRWKDAQPSNESQLFFFKVNFKHKSNI